MHKRILFLTCAVPPRAMGSGVIARNLAKEFSRHEMILAGEQPYEGQPFTWREEWPPIFYLTKQWPTHWRGERWWHRLVFPLLLLRCLRLARKQKCNAVLVVCPPEEFLLAGYLTARWTGASLFPYFHNTYLENRKGLRRLFACWLQSRVFSKAEHVFVMSEGIVELYRERYPALKCSALVQCLNDGIPDFVPPRAPGSPLRLAICGNIIETCLEAAIRICDAVSQMEDASLTLLPPTPSSYLERLVLLRKGVRYHPVIDQKEVVTRLRESDIVVLPHGFSGALSSEEYRTIFPTRTLEYLVCGRPILAHTPPDCYLTRFLRKHSCALVVDQPSIPALIAAIETLRSNGQMRADLVRNALRTAEMFRGSRVATALRARLKEEVPPPAPVLSNDTRS